MKLIRATYINSILLLAALFFTATSSAVEAVKRTSLNVANLSCSSCLATIEAQMKKVDGALGMNGNSRLGLVVIDHRSEIDGDAIAAAITSLGYPAKVDWTATITRQNAYTFTAADKVASSCGGDCGSIAGNNKTGPRLWNQEIANKGNIIETSFVVTNLSCSSCLENIEAQLRGLPGTVGMLGDLGKGLINVAHVPSLAGQKIADVITAIGYPAKVISTTGKTTYQTISVDRKTNSVPASLSRSYCNGRECSSPAEAWKELYRRYIKKQNYSSK